MKHTYVESEENSTHQGKIHTKEFHAGIHTATGTRRKRGWRRGQEGGAGEGRGDEYHVALRPGKSSRSMLKTESRADHIFRPNGYKIRCLGKENSCYTHPEGRID